MADSILSPATTFCHASLKSSSICELPLSIALLFVGARLVALLFLFVGKIIPVQRSVERLNASIIQPLYGRQSSIKQFGYLRQFPTFNDVQQDHLALLVGQC